MKCTIPEISWHNRDPVLSVDIQASKSSDSLYRLATGGTDSHVLIWLLSIENSGAASPECAADLSRHSKPVNCVRFSPSGDLLASGDDESCIIIWKMKTGNDPVDFLSAEEDNFKEQWTSAKVLRGHLQDVYDLCWSADSRNLISGSVDNTAILWDVASGKNLGILGEHKGFVQGVAWDPCGQYVATMSSDRVCRVYNASSRRVVSRAYKGFLPGVDAETVKPSHFFHDDTLKSFFRRLTFTPDGELLIVPSGLVEETDKKSSNSTLIFSRNCWQKPAAYLPSLNQYTVAVRCCPVFFTLRAMQSQPLFDLPYRVVIAVATQCSVVLYDTQHAAPFAFITKIHYTRLTDISWSSDGRVLVVSSTDGYCSVITFAENELGTVYTGERKPEVNKQKQDSKTSNSVCEEKNIVNGVREKHSSGVEEKPPMTYDSANLTQTEDANLPSETNSNKVEKPIIKTSLDTEIIQSDKKKSGGPQTVSEPKDTPMDIDDFQLVYEGTITEPVLEPKTSIHKEQNNSGKLRTEEVVESVNKPSGGKASAGDKQDNVLAGPRIDNQEQLGTTERSPHKSTGDTKSLQEESFSSPKSSGTVGTNVTPGNSNKKTPRRVQLITLSSPKSKKKLLQ